MQSQSSENIKPITVKMALENLINLNARSKLNSQLLQNLQKLVAFYLKMSDFLYENRNDPLFTTATIELFIFITKAAETCYNFNQDFFTFQPVVEKSVRLLNNLQSLNKDQMNSIICFLEKGSSEGLLFANLANPLISTLKSSNDQLRGPAFFQPLQGVNERINPETILKFMQY